MKYLFWFYPKQFTTMFLPFFSIDSTKLVEPQTVKVTNFEIYNKSLTHDVQNKELPNVNESNIQI